MSEAITSVVISAPVALLGLAVLGGIVFLFPWSGPRWWRH